EAGQVAKRLGKLGRSGVAEAVQRLEPRTGGDRERHRSIIVGAMSDSPSRATIRRARRGDVPAIYHLAAVHDVHLEGPEGVGPAYIDRLFGDGTVLVSERDGRVVGVAAAVSLHPASGSHALGRSHVSDLFVEPDEHGSGVGGPLFRALLEAHRDER